MTSLSNDQHQIDDIIQSYPDRGVAVSLTFTDTITVHLLQYFNQCLQLYTKVDAKFDLHYEFISL